MITIFQKLCQRCKLLVHRNVSQKGNCWVRFIFSYHCRSLSQRKIDFGKKKLLLSCQNCFRCVQQKNWWKTLQNLHYCYSFSTLSKKIEKFVGKISAVMSKLPISGSDGTFAGKTIFRKTTSFLSYSGFGQESFRHLLKLFRLVCQYYILGVQRKVLRRKNFFMRSVFFHHFRPLIHNFLEFCGRNDCSGWEIAFFVSGGVVWGFVFGIHEIFHIFLASSGKFSDFWQENFWQGCRHWV